MIIIDRYIKDDTSLFFITINARDIMIRTYMYLVRNYNIFEDCIINTAHVKTDMQNVKKLRDFPFEAPFTNAAFKSVNDPSLGAGRIPIR